MDLVGESAVGSAVLYCRLDRPQQSADHFDCYGAYVWDYCHRTGVSVLMYYFELKKVLPGYPWYLILIGVLDLLVGLYLVFNPAVSVTFLPMLFVIWFLIDSIMNIFLAFRLKDSQRSWFWVRLTLGILGVVIGFALAGNLLAAIISVTYLIAFYFFTGAIIKLIDAFV
ncbi:HdeD family acid-resistance protein [Streptococcus parasuis]|uniref:HdeD family acid-resistance protein n=1 Tax=Streptococcus parasuis TaxID=1501662 RepID=UPI002378963F|nr:DUF308 domain-containing protein [Streptococcus parasuis]WDM38238.1 DUF308 domain-containing protein [Streptococcus parasuis]